MAALVTPLAVLSAGTDPAQLTLERIFAAKEFKEEKVETIRWSKRGAHYFAMEASGAGQESPSDEGDGGAKELARHEAESGGKTVLADAASLTPPGAKKPLAVSDFALSEDESRVLLFTDAKKVWRRKTRGDYWVFDVATKELQKLGGDAKPSTLMFAKFSPDGSRVAFVRENNIEVQNLADGKIVRLTSDGSDSIINGTSDWVNEEELGLRDGFRWSPDGSRILFWQFDTGGVKRLSLVNQTDSDEQRFTTFSYPTAGGTNSAARLGVVNADGSDLRWLDLPGDPREHYLPQADWTPDGGAVQLLQFNRLQNELRVIRADPSTGSARVVLTETDAAWVENKNTIRWIGDGGDFVWLSERSGWRHAYRVTAEGKVHPLTSGDFDVIEIAAVDAAGGWLYFLASPDNATRRDLYRAALSGGEPQRLAPADQPGTHAYDISPDARWAIHTHSSLVSAPVAALVSLPAHETVRPLKTQAALREKLARLNFPQTEFLKVDIGGVILDGWMVKPPDFDPARKYPLFLQVYGEPAGQTVKDAWGGQRMLWHWMLAQQGYVVASVDTRGTPGPRGRDWRKATYRQLGILNSTEQAAAARALLERFDFLDPKRVGIWGWSGGGSSALDAIFRHPDLYRAAIAVAPVADRTLYNTIYEERYMGLPADNADGYRLGSPLAVAKDLQGDLLIVHGTGDDNVHYRGTEKLINELVARNKHFTVMPYPNRDHSVNTGSGTSRHLYELMTRFLRERLPAD